MASWVNEVLNIGSKGLKTVEDYEKQFDLIAEKLLNECSLQINDRPHRFIEIEFYYTDAIHADPFTHKDKDQQTCGQWYFHKIGSQYKGGTYKGLDITCGSPNAHGGILIRGIQDLETGEIKDGSCVCVDHILQLNNVDSIKDLTMLKIFNFNVTGGNANRIVPNTNMPKVDVVKSARVGLNMKKKEDNQTEYVMKPYRYLAYPTYTKKGKIHIALTLHMQGKTPQQIQQATGSPLSSISTWIDLYQKGYNTNITNYVNMALDNESLCQAMGAWAKQYYKANNNSAPKSAPKEIVIASTLEELLKITIGMEQNLPQFRSMLNQLRMHLNSYNEADALSALTTFRRFLSLDSKIAPLQDVYEAGLIPKFVELLRKAENPAMQTEAAWALTNIACSPKFDHIQAIFDADVFALVIQLLSSSNESVYDQALWLVANLLGFVDEPENEKKVMQYRKKFIELDIIPVLCQMGQAEQKTSVAANIAWALDNVLRGAEFVPQLQALAVLPVLAKLLQVAHPEATSYSAMAVARLVAKHDETIIQRVLDIDELPKSLINLLCSSDKHTKHNASKALANLTGGTPQQVLALLNQDLLPKLFEAVGDGDPSKSFVENTAKILEHVTLAADETILGMVIDVGVFSIEQIVPSIANLPNYIWALSNATFAANEHQLDYFVARDIHKQLGTALCGNPQVAKDKDFHVAILEGLENLLRRAPKAAKNLPAAVKKHLQQQTSHSDADIRALATTLVQLIDHTAVTRK